MLKNVKLIFGVYYLHIFAAVIEIKNKKLH